MSIASGATAISAPSITVIALESARISDSETDRAPTWRKIGAQAISDAAAAVDFQTRTRDERRLVRRKEDRRRRNVGRLRKSPERNGGDELRTPLRRVLAHE